MPYFDSHAHISSVEILPHIHEVIERAKKADVLNVLNICTDPKTLASGLSLAKKYPGICNAGATTPHDAKKDDDDAFLAFATAARAGDLVAIGETGLDYYYKELNPKTQKQFLKRYLQLALECKLPVIFHCREAFSDLFEFVDAEYEQGAPAILHCFTGSVQEAEAVLSRGWYLSLSGIVTFKKSELLREVAKLVPLDQLLIETDAPYLAPQSKRGKQNEPSYLVETASCIAAAKGVSLEVIRDATLQNAQKLFKM